MTKVHVLARGNSWGPMLAWLKSNCQIEVSDINSRIYYSHEVREGPACEREIATTDPDFGACVADSDVVIVCGDNLEESLADLLSRGITNIFNGNEILRQSGVAARFLARAASSYNGPNAPIGPGLPIVEAARFSLTPLDAESIPRHSLFIVNSMPKSGTVWMSAMLEAILNVKARTQITISHVGDIEQDWNKPNNHAAVALVRDLRDVVVSWFHNACRTDLALGFERPRYPDIESFYHQHFLGTIFATDRFYHGNLVHWLDIVGANYIPLLRYEDVVAETPAALRKVMSAWRIKVSDQVLQETAQRYAFDQMERTVADDAGFVGAMIRDGHLRRGKVGGWATELPVSVADDITRRFSDYQRRLGYV